MNKTKEIIKNIFIKLKELISHNKSIKNVKLIQENNTSENENVNLDLSAKNNKKNTYIPEKENIENVSKDYIEFFKRLEIDDKGEIDIEDLIKTRLSENVKEIIYDYPLKGSVGNYYEEEKKIVIHPALIGRFRKLTLYHELNHTASTHDNKVGFKTINTLFGIGLNEGITQSLAEEAVGITDPTSYPIQKAVYRIFTKIADKKDFVHDYLLGTEKVEQTLQQKYGDMFLLQYKILGMQLDNATVALINYSCNPNKEKKEQFKETLIGCYKGLDGEVETLTKLFLEQSKDTQKNNELLSEVTKYQNIRTDPYLHPDIEPVKVEFSKEFCNRLERDRTKRGDFINNLSAKGFEKTMNKTNQVNNSEKKENRENIEINNKEQNFER